MVKKSQNLVDIFYLMNVDEPPPFANVVCERPLICLYISCPCLENNCLACFLSPFRKGKHVIQFIFTLFPVAAKQTLGCEEFYSIRCLAEPSIL